MEKSKRLVIMGIGILIIVLLSVIVIMEISPQDKEGEEVVPNDYVPANNQETESEPEPVNTNFEESELRQAVPEGVKVPSADEEVPEGLKDIVAVPKSVFVPQTGETSLRVFEIKAEGGKFIPSQIIVNYNDIVQIKITAVDKDYDFVLGSYGMKQLIKQGETRKIDFQAYLDGRFVYYCDLCGGSETETKGEIVVVK